MKVRNRMTENSSDVALYKKIRHSLAHVMAQAVLEMQPQATLGCGPPIDDGFYYDFILPTPITEHDFGDIEKRMRKIIRRRQPFVREEVQADAALARLAEAGQELKRRHAQELVDVAGDAISFYTNGPFRDLCRGPHVDTTGDLPEHRVQAS